MMLACCMAVFLHMISFTGATQSGIVAGRRAKPHSRPYMVALQDQKALACGGFLIREDFVLTAAHCRREQMTVLLGADNIKKPEKSQQSIPVAKYHPHPDYHNRYNDIMLLQLKTNATLNKYVKLIELPKRNKEIKANTKCDVAGWGQTGPNKPSSDVLLEGTVKIQFKFECKNKWQKDFDSQRMLCTHTDKKKGGICQGDSGGPLICKNKAQGIVSFTKEKGCDDPKMPHVFTKVAYFLKWIESVLQRSGDAAPNHF
ncbi:granzyme B-like [Genypterus blacodes]|uniref:granzyme B-like n=1 Tax=Genypterus blacodes TaxID=154954 RepID=UPI003F76166F